MSPVDPYVRLLSITIFVGLVVGFMVIFFIPFPYGLMVGMAIPIMIMMFIFANVHKRFGTSFSTILDMGSKRDFYCMACGRKSKDRTCKHCGSHMRRLR